MAFQTRRCSSCQRLASVLAKKGKPPKRWLCVQCHLLLAKLPPRNTVAK